MLQTYPARHDHKEPKAIRKFEAKNQGIPDCFLFSVIYFYRNCLIRRTLIGIMRYLGGHLEVESEPVVILMLLIDVIMEKRDGNWVIVQGSLVCSSARRGELSIKSL